MIRITDSKYRNKIQNGSDFLGNASMFNERLDGNVGEVVQWEVDFELAKIYISTLSSVFNVIADGSDWIIEGVTFDFENEDVRIGDNFNLYSNASTGAYTLGYSGTVNWVNKNQFGFTATSGSPTVGSLSDHAINFDIDAADVLDFTYSLNEQDNFASPIDITEQTYTFDGIIGASGLIGAIKSNSSAWSYELPAITEGTPIITPYKRRVFSMVHRFILNPYGTEEVKDFIENQTRPTYFDKSLKFNARFDIRRASGDGVLLSEKVIRDAQVGWFNRIFNSSNKTVNITNLQYIDNVDLVPVEGIQTNRETKVTFDIEDVNLTGYVFNFIYSCLPQQGEYQGKLKTYTPIWQYEDFRTVSTGLDTGVIKSVTITTGATNNFEVIIDPTLENSTNVNENNQYLLALQLWDNDINNFARPIHPIAYGDYFKNNDIPNLLTWNSLRLFPHNDDVAFEGNSAGYTDYNGYAQDSITFRAKFTINTDVYLPQIRQARVSIQIKNTSSGEDFELNGFDISYNQGVNGIGQVFAFTNENIGYNLKSDDPNNISRFEYLSNTATTFSEQLDSAIRIQWQKWNALKDALNSYFDITLQQNGKNKDGSRYWSATNTEVYLQVKLGLLADNTITDYVVRSSPITVHDFDYVLDWVTDMKVTDLFGNNLEGKVIEGENAYIETIHTLPAGTIDPNEDYDVIHSFEKELSGSEYGLVQASTKRGFLDSSILDITQTKSSASIITKTLLNAGKLSGIYNLYSRMLTNYVDVPLPLDGIDGVGFAFIKLRKAYTGFAAKIRNTLSPTGATSIDIGFNGNDADIAAIEGFVGVGNPFYIEIMYNQGTLGGDMTLSTTSNVFEGVIVSGQVEIRRNFSVEPRYRFEGSTALFDGKHPEIIIDQVHNTVGAASAQSIMGTTLFGAYARLMGTYNAGGGVNHKALFRDNAGIHLANPLLPSGGDSDWTIWDYKKRSSTDGFGQVIRDDRATQTTYATSVAIQDWGVYAINYYLFNTNSSGDAWRGKWRVLMVFENELSAMDNNTVVQYLKDYYA